MQAIKVRRPTICIKNRTNIYSYAFSYMHSKCQQTKKNNSKQKKSQKELNFWHSVFIDAAKKQKEKNRWQKIVCFWFWILLWLLILTFVWELFLTHFMFVWIRFIKKISTIYQFEIRKTKKHWKENWNARTFAALQCFLYAKRMRNLPPYIILCQGTFLAG